MNEIIDFTEDMRELLALDGWKDEIEMRGDG